MSFFDMGIGEVLLIVIVALIIWGPGKIPQVARTIGKTIATLKKTSQELTAQITRELEEDEEEKNLPPDLKIKSRQGAYRTHQAEKTPQPGGLEAEEGADSSEVDKQ